MLGLSLRLTRSCHYFLSIHRYQRIDGCLGGYRRLLRGKNFGSCVQNNILYGLSSFCGLGFNHVGSNDSHVVENLVR